MGAGSTGSALVLVWAWGLAFPEDTMPPDVAIGALAVIGAAWSRVEAWLENRGRADG
jgi:hypothetical protein